MQLHSLNSVKNSRHKSKIVGRGIGSGMGKTSTRGHKGQKARKSGNVRIGFEGGQTPLLRRIPKWGFNNSIFQINYIEVNLDALNKLKDCKEIDLETLISKKLIKVASSQNNNLKILGNGEISIPLTIKAHKFSKSAIAKIEKAGGKAIVITNNNLKENKNIKK